MNQWITHRNWWSQNTIYKYTRDLVNKERHHFKTNPTNIRFIWQRNEMCVGLYVCSRVVGFWLWTGSVLGLMVEGCHVLTATISHEHGVWPITKCSVSVRWQSHSPPAALTNKLKKHHHHHIYIHSDYVRNTWRGGYHTEVDHFG